MTGSDVDLSPSDRGWRRFGTPAFAIGVLVFINGLYLAFVAFGNITDFGTNQPFVQHVLSMDTTKLPDVMRRASVDVVVTDLPYGVQHGSHGSNGERLARSPLRLLDRALPGWHDALRTGGTIGLAYNRHVAGPEAMAEALEAHGFTVVHGHGVDGPTQGHVAADAFRHRVDASIDRDIVVARKG